MKNGEKKMLKNRIGLIMLVMFFVLSSSNVVMAEDGYCTGVVVKEAGAKTVNGVSRNALLLQTTQTCGNWGSGGMIWAYLDTANQDAMLAAALTALGMGKPVTVVSALGNTYVNWGTIIHVSVTP